MITLCSGAVETTGEVDGSGVVDLVGAEDQAADETAIVRDSYWDTEATGATDGVRAESEGDGAVVAATDDGLDRLAGDGWTRERAGPFRAGGANGGRGGPDGRPSASWLWTTCVGTAGPGVSGGRPVLDARFSFQRIEDGPDWLQKTSQRGRRTFLLKRRKRPWKIYRSIP